MFKISILVPVFNVEEYISAAFESILNQTIGFDNLEVIFVDDASTDQSAKIIDEYASKYENVISIHLESNSGDAGRPRNVAMEYATADYIMFLDPDDIFMDNACEILYDEIVNDNVDIVSGVHCNGEEVPNFIWLNTLTDPNESWNKRKEKVQSMVKDSNFSLKINSIEDYPSIIANSNIWNKIFKKSLIVENNIKSPEGMPAQDSVFLLETFLNADGIKFINKVILMHDYNRNDSVGHQVSKQRIFDRLNAYYKMYYLCLSKNKSEEFKHYLLLDKLQYIVKNHLMLCDLPTKDIIEVFDYSMPLFKLYYEFNNNIRGKYSELFKLIAQKDYENAIRYIQNDNIPYQKDIKVAGVLNSFWHDSLLDECEYVNLDSRYWFIKLKNEKPDLFIFEYPNEKQDMKLNDVLEFCKDNQIITIFLSTKPCKSDFIKFCTDFDYIFTTIKEDDQFYMGTGKNVCYLDADDTTLKLETKMLNDENFFNSLVNQYRFRQILDKIKYKYVPNFKHIVLLYEVNDLNDLIGIYKHYNSIGYSLKYIKLITNEKNSFLSDSISKKELEEIKKDKKYYLLKVNEW